MKTRIHILLWGIILTGIVWGLYALGIGPLLEHTKPVQQKLVSAAAGKITDGGFYLNLLVKELCILFTWVIVLMAAYVIIAHPFTEKFRSPLLRLGSRTLVLFLLVNLFAGLASQRIVYWMALWDSPPHIYTQFNIKRLLYHAAGRPHTAVILGSSQAMAQISEETLNQDLGSSLYTTELHFPGSFAMDLPLIQNTLSDDPPSLYLVYLNENNFYGFNGERFMYFLNPSGLWRLIQSRGLEILSDRQIAYAALSMTLPLFRQRDVLMRRLLGAKWALLEGTGHQENITALSLDDRADLHLRSWDMAHWDLNQKGFSVFMEQAERQGSWVVILRGQSHPALVNRIPKKMTRRFDAYLASLLSHATNVMILQQAELLIQDAEDYVDLTHVNKNTQKRFSTALARALRKNFQTFDIPENNQAAPQTNGVTTTPPPDHNPVP